MVRIINSIVKFSNVGKIGNIEDYDDDEFAIADVTFLSTKPNSHELVIRENILKEFAPTVLGKWLVADYSKYEQDVTDHTPNESIMGNFPQNQDIQFSKTKDGYLSATAKAVISKLYAKNFYDLFKNDNFRDVSVEMKVATQDKASQEIVDEFKITAVTALGKKVEGSCPDANMSIVKFSKEDAEKFEKNTEKFYEEHTSQLEKLKKFSEERRKNMAENKTYTKTYKVDTSKESVSEGAWDGDKTKHDAVEAKNFESIAPKIFMRLEDGWKDRELTKLDYPVMTLEGDTFVYSKKGLASAEGYAKKGNETDVLNKVQAIQKELGLGEEQDEKMSEKVDKKDEKAKADEKEKDEEMKAKAKMSEDDDAKDDDCDGEEMSSDANVDPAAYAKMMEDESDRNKALLAQLSEKDDIIMANEAELAELRKFKSDTEEMAKQNEVNQTMADVKACLEDEDFENLKAEGMACNMSQIEGWKNKVKSVAFEAIKKSKPIGSNSLWKMSGVDDSQKESKGLWD